MRHVTQNLQDPQVLRNKRAAWVLGKSPSAEAHRDRSMVRVRLRVNGDARSGLFIKVGSGTDFPNIHRLREAIGVTLFADPSYGLNIETESVWAAAAIDFYMNGRQRQGRRLVHGREGRRPLRRGARATHPPAGHHGRRVTHCGRYVNEASCRSLAPAVQL